MIPDAYTTPLYPVIAALILTPWYLLGTFLIKRQKLDTFQASKLDNAKPHL